MKKCSFCNIEKPSYEFASEEGNLCFACKMADLYTSKQFCCPNCQSPLQFSMSIDIKKVKIAEGSTIDKKQAALENDNLSYDEKMKALKDARLITEARNSGLLKLFREAHNLSFPDNAPLNIETTFLGWMENAEVYKIPAFALQTIRDLIPGTNHIILQRNSVIGVLVDGYLKMFLATKTVLGEKVKVGTIKTRVEADYGQFVNWIRTKNGYVVGRGMMFDELKGKTPGAFALK